MSDLHLDLPALEARAAAVGRVRDALESCARHLRDGSGAGLGAPGLESAWSGFTGTWGDAAAALAAQADDARGVLSAAGRQLLAVDRALAGS